MEKILFKKSLIIGVILLVSSIFSPSLTADNLYDKDVVSTNYKYTLLPTDDAWIRETIPSENYGHATHLNFRSFQNGYNWQNLIKFDLSQIPSNVEIVYAKMYIYYFDWGDNNPSGDMMRLYRALESWNEDTVTWNNQPSVFTQASSQTIVPSSSEIWMSWDVTEDVIDFISGDLSNYGWLIKDDTFWGGVNIPYGQFYSKEFDALHPYLEIEIAGNEPLVVDADGPYEGNIMEDIEFDCTVTGGVPPYEYLWYYGDGNTSSGDPHPTHNYGNAGNYTVTLTVTDSEDDIASDSTWTYINAPPNKPSATYKKDTDELIISATDSDNDQIRYGISWDNDYIVDQWTGFVGSGTEQSINCNDRKGTVGVIAEDELGAQSDWVSVTSKTKAFNLQLFLQRFFQCFPFFEKILKQIL